MSVEAAPRLASLPWLWTDPVRQVLTMFDEAGHKARFVGGCVRDSLLDPNLVDVDLDLTTTARPKTVMALAKAKQFRAIPTGLAHGTVTVLVGDERFEVTTLRRDVETDGRHATVAFTDDFRIDAGRRDLTINAMGCDGDGNLYDEFGGEEDLLAGRIRFVGEPAIRIAEDTLRILRYFRFFARFGKIAPDELTQSALGEAAPQLNRISGERLQKEVAALLVSERAELALNWMGQLGVTRALFGADGSPKLVGQAAADRAWIANLALWLGDDCDPQMLAQRLKLSRADADDLRFFSQTVGSEVATDRKERRRALALHGPCRVEALLRTDHARRGGFDLGRALEDLSAEPRPVFSMRGRDLLALGVEPGPAIGEILSKIEAAWLESGCWMSEAECLTLARQLAGLRS